jgi:hypothetical protein
MKNTLKHCLQLLIIFTSLSACKPGDKNKANEVVKTAKNGAVRPEDILADDKDFATFQVGETTVVGRKGTIAASVMNAQVIGSGDTSPEQKAAALLWLKENALVISVILKGQLLFKNPEIQKIIEAAQNGHQK